MPTIPDDLTVVHDYVTQRGGAERVVLDILDHAPGSRLVTAAYNPATTFPGYAQHRITTSPINRVPVFRRDPRLALPFLAPTFSAIRFDEPVVLVSSSGWAHGVSNTGAKVIYCHNPARWLYQTDEYLAQTKGVAKPALRMLSPALRRWDEQAAHGPRMTYIANSTSVQQRIKAAYGIDAIVIPPPVAVTPRAEFEPVPGIEPGYLMTVGRNRGYKNIDAVCAAMALLPDERLVVVGGPVEDAPANVTVLSGMSDAQLGWLYQNTAGLVALAFEDFGLTPLECNALGRPVVALRRGGYLDSVVDGLNGLFVDSLAPEVVAEGVLRLLAAHWDSDAIRAHAGDFRPERFLERVGAVVDTALMTV